MIVFLNGQWMDLKNAKVSVLDQGILRGDGLFETLRARGGKVHLLPGHLDRLYNTAEFTDLEIPISKEEFTKAVETIIKKNHLSEARLRIVVTRGVGETMDPRGKATTPTYFILAEPLSEKPFEKEHSQGVQVITTPVAIYNALFPLSVKAISYFHNMAAKRVALKQGAFEAILTDASGYCTEGATSNLFWVLNERVYSPPLHAGALPGVTRKHLIEVLKKMNKPLLEEKIKREDLYQTNEIFITSSVVGILPVHTIDDHKISKGPGVITRQVKEAFEKHLEKL